MLQSKERQIFTRYWKVDPLHPDEAVLRQAGELIRAGGLVAFPTETVYGLGGDALNSDSSRRIYAAKGRPSDNPLIVHICKTKDMEAVTQGVSEAAWRLAEAFWPGPLTMVLPRGNNVPPETTGGRDTVAVRLPSHPVAQGLIAAAGGFVAAPSANRSGRPSPTNGAHCREDLDGRVDAILDAGETSIGLESTIVDLTGNVPELLRPGFYTAEDLSRVLGQPVGTKTVADTEAGRITDARAPGMKYRHYAPAGELTIVEGERAAVIAHINGLLDAAKTDGKKTGVLCTAETRDAYRADCVQSIGHRDREEELAHHLFAALRAFDEEGVQVIFAESFPQTGVSAAVQNRLIKAAGHRKIHL